MVDWKSIAIVFIIITLLETSLMVWGYSMNIDEEEKNNFCSYDICKDYPVATMEGNICYCYDYDENDKVVLVEQEWIK